MRHDDEPALAALIIAIVTINAWNRINVTTRQVAGSGRSFAAPGGAVRASARGDQAES